MTATDVTRQGINLPGGTPSLDLADRIACTEYDRWRADPARDRTVLTALITVARRVDAMHTGYRPLENTLTPAQIRCLQLACHGLSNAEIAKELFIGEHTAKTHLHRVFAKLGARNRAHAVALGLAAGLITFADSDDGPDFIGGAR